MRATLPSSGPRRVEKVGKGRRGAVKEGRAERAGEGAMGSECSKQFSVQRRRPQREGHRECARGENVCIDYGGRWRSCVKTIKEVYKKEREVY